MRMRREVFLLSLVCMVVLVPLRAQSPLGTILGTVEDQSGGLVPGASVTLKNIERGYQRSTKSDANGDFRLPDLLPGTYDLSVEGQGFKKFEQTGVPLLAQQTMRLDVKLELGPTTQLITVSGAAPVVNTDTATINEDLPPVKLEKYMVPTTEVWNTMYFLNYYGLDGVTGAGTTTNILGAVQNRWTSDGMVVDGFQADPPADATNEVKVIDVDAPAEYATPATTTLTTKGGTNDFHVSTGWFFPNGDLSALGPVHTTRPPGTATYEFGVTAGGPVVIPHVYNGRNRTFFFANIDKAKTTLSVGFNPVDNVPTLAMRNGDFTTYTNTSGQVIPIYDPLTGSQIQCNGVLNMICQGRVSSVATNFMKYYLPPPDTGSATSAVRNWVRPNTAAPDGSSAKNIEHFRGDQNISKNDTLNFDFNRYVQTTLTDPAGAGGASIVAGLFLSSLRANNYTATMGETHVFGPHTVNEFRMGYYRDFQPRTTLVNGQTVLSNLGIQGINPGYSFGGLPQFTINGLEGMSTSYNEGFQTENRFNFIDNLTRQFGKHSVKVGANLIHGGYNTEGPGNTNPVFGSYSFTGRFTENTAGAGGASFADFLLGVPDTVTRYTPRPNVAVRWATFGMYAQDDWKFSPRVTLNLGLRYELDGMPYDQSGLYFGFDRATGAIVLPSQKALNSVSPLFNKSIPLELASQAGFPGHLINQNYTYGTFLPRLGVAFRPFNNNKTAFRAGYGVYRIGLLSSNFAAFTGNALVQTGGPFALTESYINTETPTGPTLSMPDPFPGTPGSAASTYAISATAPNLHAGYTQQWNATVEQEIWGTAFSFSYIGSESINLPWMRNLNLPPPSTTPFVSSSCATPGVPLPNPTCRYMYYGFSSISYIDNGGLSSYNGFHFEVRHPITKGLYMHAGYIYNHQINETGAALATLADDPYNRRYDRTTAGSPGSQLQRAVIDWVYTLPVGRGQHFLSHPTDSRLANGVIQGVVGGWSTSAFLGFFSGEPFTVTDTGTDPMGEGIFSGRPDRIGSGKLANPTFLNYFNSTLGTSSSAFQIPASDIGRPGNAAENILWGPRCTRDLVSVFKEFQFTDKVKLRVDAAFTDPFNNQGTSFGLPAAVLNTVGVGVQATSDVFDSGARTILLDGRLWF